MSRTIRVFLRSRSYHSDPETEYARLVRRLRKSSRARRVARRLASVVRIAVAAIVTLMIAR